MPEDLAALLASVDPAQLGQRIRAARRSLDLTQGEVAGADASVAFVSRIESGKRRPDLALLQAMAGRLRTTALALLTGAPDPTASRLRVALDHAELALRSGSPDAAEELLESVREDVESFSDPDLRAAWRLTSALTAEARGALDDAITGLEDLLEASRSVPDATRIAIALSRCYRESGDLSRAISTGERCLTSLRDLGLEGTDDAVQLAVTVAAAHFVLGDVGHAVRLARRAVKQAEDVGSDAARASAYWNASIMESRRGATEAALPLAEKALRLLDSAEGNRNVARLRSQLGIFQLRVDPPDADGAIENLTAAAEELAWSSASPVDKGRNAVALARARLLTGEPTEALAQAEGVHRDVGSTAPLLDAGALTVMGEASFALGQPEQAAAHYRQAVAVLTGVGSDRGAADSWFELAALLDELGLRDEAHDAYRNAAVASGAVSAAGLRRLQQH
ncbi:tetratricopeptide repeat protein [Nocardioides anomalus]|uniref:Tetratricopeptide repeat protein n=1 Tax=Nocardioides anomalus TaxID=2712223 RepID=A0A6G6WJB5_9ACTN|nr:helix-turn-helix domain-containing protein [Nocardioides anomalus]QIG45319.1 tetratricopeptide repeat protein [Nocardioides anomalus]